MANMRLHTHTHTVVAKPNPATKAAAAASYPDVTLAAFLRCLKTLLRQRRDNVAGSGRGCGTCIRRHFTSFIIHHHKKKAENGHLAIFGRDSSLPRPVGVHKTRLIKFRSILISNIRGSFYFILLSVKKHSQKQSKNAMAIMCFPLFPLPFSKKAENIFSCRRCFLMNFSRALCNWSSFCIGTFFRLLLLLLPLFMLLLLLLLSCLPRMKAKTSETKMLLRIRAVSPRPYKIWVNFCRFFQKHFTRLHFTQTDTVQWLPF